MRRTTADGPRALVWVLVSSAFLKAEGTGHPPPGGGVSSPAGTREPASSLWTNLQTCPPPYRPPPGEEILEGVYGGQPDAFPLSQQPEEPQEPQGGRFPPPPVKKGPADLSSNTQAGLK